MTASSRRRKSYEGCKQRSSDSCGKKRKQTRGDYHYFIATIPAKIAKRFCENKTAVKQFSGELDPVSEATVKNFLL